MDQNPGGFNMADIFGQMMNVRQRMEEAQAKLADKTATAEAGGGMVKVTANGLQRVVSIELDHDAVGDDKELLEDLIIAGVNKALEAASELAQSEMQGAYRGMMPPGLDLGGLGSLLGGK
jgi:DNA-binding YbaB/EbfC family protein